MPDLQKSPPKIEFHQHDWIPGWAAFLDFDDDACAAKQINPESKAFCVLNLGAFIAAIELGDMNREDLPYHIAESMMHEVIHAIEKWVGVEFSEERIEALCAAYREKYAVHG